MSLSPGAYSPARASDPVKVYQSASKGGTSASFDRVGKFDINSQYTGVGNGTISSIDVSPGYTVEGLKSGQNPGSTGTRMFTGYTASMPSGWDNIIDEIVISQTTASTPATSSPSPATSPSLLPGVYSPARASDPVKVYQSASKGGTSASFDRVGKFDINSQYTGVGNGTISSIDVSPGYTVEGLKSGQNPGSTGTRMFTGYTASMPSGWDNIIDEIVISQTTPPSPSTTPPSPSTTPRPAPAPTPGEEPEEGSSWWIWLIVSIIVVLLGVGGLMLTMKK